MTNIRDNDNSDDSIMGDENPLYIRVSKRRYAILTDRESEYIRLKRSIQRALRNIKIDKSEE